MTYKFNEKETGITDVPDYGIAIEDEVPADYI